MAFLEECVILGLLWLASVHLLLFMITGMFAIFAGENCGIEDI